MARQVEEERGDYLGRPSFRLTITGISVRDKRGSTCDMMFDPSGVTALAAVIYDRLNHVRYTVDFRKKTVRRQEVDLTAEPHLKTMPMSAEEFDRLHSEDKLLGRKVVSGFLCEGYKLRDPHRKGKFLNEVWYAPSLNFAPIKSEGALPSGWQIRRSLEDIQVGKEPDPKLFEIPKDFKFIE